MYAATPYKVLSAVFATQILVDSRVGRIVYNLEESAEHFGRGPIWGEIWLKLEAALSSEVERSLHEDVITSPENQALVLSFLNNLNPKEG